MQIKTKQEKIKKEVLNGINEKHFYRLHPEASLSLNKLIYFLEEIQSSMDLQLQAYALELGDPDVLREKLAQKMIEKKKRDAALASSGQQQNSEKNVKSSHVGNITLYYDTSNAHALTGQNEESLSDTEENDENNCETIGAAYPWYRNAPMQHEIGEKFLNSSDTIYNERPQKPVESNRVMRTFPKRSKTVKEYPNGVSPGSDIHIHNQHVKNVFIFFG